MCQIPFQRVVGVPVVVLLGQVTSFWQIVVLTALIWFFGGIGLTLSTIFLGQYADNNKRGKSFGLMFLAFPVAMLISGAVVGWLIEWQGYPVMFTVVGLVFALFPIAAFLRPADSLVVNNEPKTKAINSSKSRLSKAFYLLLAVSFLIEASVYSSRMVMSIAMDALSFSAGAISGTSIVSGIAAILFGLIISTYSDKFGSKLFMVFGILGAVGGTLVLSVGTELWHFWLATALLFAGHTVNGAIIPAVGSSLLSKGALSKGMAKLTSMTWIAGIIGFSVTGYVIDFFGTQTLFIIATVFAVTAVVIAGWLPDPNVQSRTFVGLRRVRMWFVATVAWRLQEARMTNR